jgi:hypothetical protein
MVAKWTTNLLMVCTVILSRVLEYLIVPSSQRHLCVINVVIQLLMSKLMDCRVSEASKSEWRGTKKETINKLDACTHVLCEGW